MSEFLRNNNVIATAAVTIAAIGSTATEASAAKQPATPLPGGVECTIKDIDQGTRQTCNYYEEGELDKTVVTDRTSASISAPLEDGGYQGVSYSTVKRSTSHYNDNRKTRSSTVLRKQTVSTTQTNEYTEERVENTGYKTTAKYKLGKTATSSFRYLPKTLSSSRTYDQSSLTQ